MKTSRKGRRVSRRLILSVRTWKAGSTAHSEKVAQTTLTMSFSPRICEHILLVLKAIIPRRSSPILINKVRMSAMVQALVPSMI